MNELTYVIADKMKRCGYGNEKLAKKMNISVSTLVRKKKNPDSFTLGEIRLMEKIFREKII